MTIFIVCTRLSFGGAERVGIVLANEGMMFILLQIFLIKSPIIFMKT